VAQVVSQAQRDYVERVRQATDLVSLVSEFVPLRKAGRRHSGLCPFHGEKTASFSVDEDRGLFYCFGCHEGGDAFKFLMLIERVEFPEALRMLGERAGIEAPPRVIQGPGGGGPAYADDPGPSRSERETLLEVNRRAAACFQEFLADPKLGRAAREYIAKRGLSDETVQKLGIGFAPDSWDMLKNRLKGAGFPNRALAASGLFSVKEGSTSHYDRFRNRLIFPIYGAGTAGGQVLAFGGRTLANGGAGGENDAKYLNSPETPVYSKSETLYGLTWTREAIRKAGEAVVVEGYVDFATIFQAGVGNCVATLGTAFTPGQAKLLSRSAKSVIMNYDPDRAGVTAAKRSLDVLLPLGFQVRVAQLEGGLDPDGFVREKGAEAYRAALAGAPTGIEFLLAQAAAGRNLAEPAQRGMALEDVLPHLVKIENAAERSAWAGRVAEALRIEDAIVLDELRKSLRTGKAPVRVGAGQVAGAGLSTTSPSTGSGRASRGQVLTPPSDSEARLVHCLLDCPEARLELVNEMDVQELTGLTTRPILAAILEESRKAVTNSPDNELSLQVVMNRLGAEEERQMLTAIAFRSERAGTVEEARACLAALRRDRMRAERKKLQKEIEAAGSAGTGVPLALLRRKDELSKRIDELS
jgi:DNA primase